MKRIFLFFLCAILALSCVGCGGTSPGETPPAVSTPAQSAPPADDAPPVQSIPAPEVKVYEDGEIAVFLPAEYAGLVKTDDMGSDEQYTVKVNLYYEPAYFEHEAYVPSLNGGWLMTVSVTLPSFAAHPAENQRSTVWTEDGTRVYVESRPLEGEYTCEAEDTEVFGNILSAITVDYGDLPPFTAEDAAAAK